MIVAVILGNRMNDNGTLSALARKRLDLAEKLYKEYSPEEIILSGGRANPNVDVTEADAMFKELKRRGNIDESVILLEGKSTSTKENAKYAVPMALKFHPDKIIVCTTHEHATRPYLNPLRLFRRAVKDNGSNVPVEIYTNNK